MKESEQIRHLDTIEISFNDAISDFFPGGINGNSVSTVQINVGKKCNQACKHCHVDASPSRTEMMNFETAQNCIRIISEIPEVQTVDITGGAPEMNPHFRYLVNESKKLGKHVIDRCNLTILLTPGFENLHEFLAENQVEIFASLPHFLRDQTDRQRGNGVFDRSIEAVRKLNSVGYGKDLKLNLVYNPIGLFLASSQLELENEFRRVLSHDYEVEFNHLYCLNNLPISRFLESLIRAEKFDDYMETLIQAFNPETLDGLMCRHQISISYDGKIFDCDFNQMLDLQTQFDLSSSEFNIENWKNRKIRTANHCFGCTAGAGSSCTGEILTATTVN